METGGRRGQSVSLAVKLFGDGADEPEVDADFTQVASHFFDTKHIGFGLNTSVDLRPEVGVSALGWGVAIKNGLETIHHGLVVDEDVDRSLSAGCEVDDGQSLSDLGILGEAMDSGTVVHAVGDAVIDPVAGPGKKWYGLVGAGAVSGCVGPGPTRGRVGIGGVGVRSLAWRGRSWDGLREGVSGQLRLEVKEPRVFIDKATVAHVWWEPAPLLVTDEVDKWGPLACPALAVTDRVLLSFFFFIAVPADGAWVSGGVRARASLLGVIAAGKVVKKKPQLPGRALGSTFSTRKPSAGEHV